MIYALKVTLVGFVSSVIYLTKEIKDHIQNLHSLNVMVYLSINNNLIYLYN